MKIRKATARDMDEITGLLIEFKEELTDFEPEDLKIFRKKEKSLNLIKKSVKKEVENKNGRLLVADDNGKIIGFAYGTILDYNHMVFRTLRYGKLNHLWVRNKYRKKGISSTLKEDMFSWFKQKKCKYIELLVLDGNHAKDIYKKWGFEVVLDTMRKRI